ncbi:ABC transporter-like [Syntrophomonas zehnderi OL-4]|uniref:ABC transporter-like n=1 Tax=Syntrophomonas zehnderi OL-4 TaxID=690567 RepID=A0A0E4GA28_9FIRM|nr:ABC transporter ATP-binding protein [Syntrophomonas zehnderi]CFX19341.1 ABC transporter-like [Syntrophomonas zehnderi OL-4]
MILDIQGLAFKYPSRPVIQNISFEVQKGECLAILGTNGVGKTTLLKCINRILKPQHGVVLVEKEEVFKLSRPELAKRIGYVSQRQGNPRYTVFDTVLLGRKPYIKWDISSRDLEVVNQVLALMDLTDFSLRFLDELSGGELQKVIIARALAQEADVLLLDEPTSNLDLKNQYEVLRIIKDVVQSKQIAAVITMHDINLAIRFADKFLFLKQGEIFTAGGMEVITARNVESVYSIPVCVEHFGNVPVVLPL